MSMLRLAKTNKGLIKHHIIGTEIVNQLNPKLDSTHNIMQMVPSNAPAYDSKKLRNANNVLLV